MSFDLNAIRQGLASLEERLRPIATRPVNINDHDWVDRLRQAPSPLDQAGVRLEAETILGSLLQAYRTEGSFVRASIRRLLAQNPSFTWATGVQESPTTEEVFRLHLLHISAVDHARDLRDTILTLNSICATANMAGVNTRPILDEVAALSSDEHKGSMGSIRSILLNVR
jgi:hypothetical protein